MLGIRMILVFAALANCQFAYGQLNGKMRDSFIESAYGACLANQRAGRVNEGVSNVALQKYCRCTSIYVADMLNNTLAAEIYEGRIKMNPTWTELSARYCRSNYEKH
jgi:hypothetical protein